MAFWTWKNFGEKLEIFGQVWEAGLVHLWPPPVYPGNHRYADKQSQFFSRSKFVYNIALIMWTLADSFFNWQILGIWQILKWDSLFRVSCYISAMPVSRAVNETVLLKTLKVLGWSTRPGTCGSGILGPAFESGRPGQDRQAFSASDWNYTESVASQPVQPNLLNTTLNT